MRIRDLRVQRIHLNGFHLRILHVPYGSRCSGGIYRCAFPEDYCEIQRKDGEEWPVLFRFPMHPIEPCDFIPLNYYIGGQPGFGFRSWRTVNLTLPNGSKALTNDHLTIRIDGEVTERDLQSRAEVEQVLREEFGLDVKLPE